MFLVRLMYVSTITQALVPKDIERILDDALRLNAKNNVTGLLCFNHKYFLQCLEGSRKTVNETYHRILQDPRHTDVVMLDYQEIVSREYPQWSMGYIPETQITAPINLKYSGDTVFNPYEMSGESAHRMMTELSHLLYEQSGSQ